MAAPGSFVRSATGGETEMGLLDWFRRRTPASAPEAAGQGAVLNVPALSDPILLFMENPAFVTLLEEVPTWQVVHTRNFGEFSAALPERKYAMLIALSPLDDSGAAGRAIRAFRQLNPGAVTVYHGHDPRIAVSGPRALACGADVLMLGGVRVRDLICCLGTALVMKGQYVIEPSLVSYTKLLEVTCAESAFWRLQNIDEPNFEIE
jgi:hypothetical protein